MSLENESQNQKHETEQPLSLAELSRRYLSGNVGVEEYLALERQLTPRFGESPVATVTIEEEIKSSSQATINQQQPPPKSNDSESNENKK